MKNQKSPISAKELRKKLSRGAVKFVFEKKDGTLRTAIGTRNLEMVPIKDAPKGTGKENPLTLNFYDLENKGWRSLSMMSHIELA